MSGAVPQLRFPGFEEGWDPKTLGDIVRISKGKGISKADIIADGLTPCVRYGELYTTYGTTIDQTVSFTNVAPATLRMSSGGEVIIPASGETSEDIATAAVVVRAGVALGGDLNILTTEQNGHFLASYVSGRKRMALAALAQGNSVVHLYPAQISSLDIALPTLPEQQKIADFLGTVDEKLDALRRKKYGLEAFKSGLMQRLFSQELRFAQDDGTDFPDWDFIPFKDAFERIRRKNPHGDENVLTISAQHGLVSQIEFFKKSVAGADLSGYYQLFVGDFAYNKSYSKGYPVGAIKRLNRYESGVVSSLYICFRAKDEASSDFYEQYFESGALNPEIGAIAQEGARNHGLLNVSVTDFFEYITVPVPHPDEQHKIADALVALDAKIAAVANQITHMETFKKGLLQQMFV